MIPGPHPDCPSSLPPDRTSQVPSTGARPLGMDLIVRLALRRLWMLLRVSRILSGSAGFRKRKYRARLSFHLEGAQRMTGICLVEEAIALARQCLLVHTAKIVEGQEAT